MGSNIRCNRQHCAHDVSEHRQARAEGGGVMVGACQHGRCECAQYVGQGLTTGNRVLDQYGDHGLGQRLGAKPQDERRRSSATRVVVYPNV